MKKVMKNFGSIVVCLIEILVGVLLLVDPVGFTAGIIIAIGGVLTVSGIVMTINYFRTDAEEARARQGLVKGLFAIIAGVFCIFQSKWFIAVFPVLTILYGAATLIAGLFKVQLTVDLLRLKRKKWGWAAFSAILTLVAAFIIICNPFSSTVVLWTFTAVMLMVEAVLDIISVIVTSLKNE